MVWNKLDISVYIQKVPKEYRDNISVLGEDKGLNTKISYINKKCQHKSITIIGSLLQRKQFDFCNFCYKSKSYISKIPKEYESFIEYLDDVHGFGSKIRYTNPKCGCVSETTLGSFVDRYQFDYCNRCLTRLRKKSVEYYLSKIPEEYRANISYKEDVGYNTKLTFALSCGCKQEINVASLLAKNQFDDCGRCESWNRLSSKTMIESLKYLENTKIVGGYPGNRTTKIVGFCAACKAKVEGYFFNLQRYYSYYDKAQCHNCMPRNFNQHDLFLFIRNLGVSVEEDNKSIIKFDSNKHKHIDIYCSDNNFGIEYNGLIWHSEKYKNDRQYHWKKTQSCLAQGITLLHIWEDKYLRNKEIYHSIIRVKLGKVNCKISARKTELRELSKQEQSLFFDNNHIDGSVPCIISWGLFKDDVLLQAISIRKINHQNRKYKGFVEIARFATLIDHLVVGGESKLLSIVEKYAMGKFKGILNYVSCDFGGYPKPKWKFVYTGTTDCSYCYTDGSSRFSRQRLQNRADNQTEAERAIELGLFRVNMTPNLVYEYKF